MASEIINLLNTIAENCGNCYLSLKNLFRKYQGVIPSKIDETPNSPLERELYKEDEMSDSNSNKNSVNPVATYQWHQNYSAQTTKSNTGRKYQHKSRTKRNTEWSTTPLPRPTPKQLRAAAHLARIRNTGLFFIETELSDSSYDDFLKKVGNILGKKLKPNPLNLTP